MDRAHNPNLFTSSIGLIARIFLYLIGWAHDLCFLLNESRLMDHIISLISPQGMSFPYKGLYLQKVSMEEKYSISRL